MPSALKTGNGFRRKGYGGYGSNWVDDISRARIFAKVSGARSQISYYANHFPEYGIPDLVVLKVTEIDVQNEADRVAKNQQKREEAKAKSEMARQTKALEQAQKALEDAKRQLDEASSKIKNRGAK
jgi:hypothetical protein